MKKENGSTWLIKGQEELSIPRTVKKVATLTVKKTACAILTEKKEKEILVANIRAKNAACAILTEEKKKEILEIKNWIMKRRPFWRENVLTTWVFHSDSDLGSNSRSNIDKEIILKEIIWQPKAYIITPKFLPIIILGEEEAVIEFEYPVDSAINILSTPGYEVNVEVRYGVIEHVHGSGMTTKPFQYMTFNGNIE